MPRLRDAPSSSPYLRDHAENPVDWYAWGDDAFAEARRRDCPVFISIGYSACHWCHVMAHESFEDDGIAAALNAGFVSVKVDREEHPDVDALYMDAVQALGGQGGWPLSVFATPDGRPFFGGTYFPKSARGHVPGFADVLAAVRAAWDGQRDDIGTQADDLTDAVRRRAAPPDDAGTVPPSRILVAAAVDRFAEMHDAEFGGVGRAPKFPQAPMLELLLRAHELGDERALEMAESALRAMATGGIYDHLGGGFARYSVDRTWTTPHFEKMLYDQAMAVRIYLHAWQVTGDPDWRQVVDETIAYVARDLRDASGGVRSAEDADSDGEEGRFYTWTRDEVVTVLGDEAAGAFAWYGDLVRPNFERGRSILRRPYGASLARPDDVEALRRRLLAARAERVRPAVDDKVITEWNAMFASALCEVAAATGEDATARIAAEIAETIWDRHRRTDGRLLRTGAGGPLAVGADYAWCVDLMTRLYELTGESRHLARAVELADTLVERFSADDGGWYMNGADAPRLVVRPVDAYDGVTPATGSIAASALARLGALTDARYTKRAERTVGRAAAAITASPVAFAHLVGAAAILERGALEIVFGPGSESLLDAVRARFLPDAVVAWGERYPGPLWEGRTGPRVFVCRGGTCRMPATTRDELARELAWAVAAP